MQRPSAVIWLIALVGVVLVPWHMPQNAATLSSLIGLGAGDADEASALWQAVAYRRWWLWPVLAAVAAAGFGVFGTSTAGSKGKWLLWSAGLGLLWVVFQGLSIGVRGWSFGFLTTLFGETSERQFGMGLGAVMTFAAFVLLVTDGLALKGYFKGDRFVSASVGVIVASIIIFTAWPVLNILSYIISPRGNLSGLEAFADRLLDRKIWGLTCVASRVSCGVFWNTLVLAISTATAATILGLSFALIVTRTGFR
jgi:iron(III) transport system permease protein